IGAIAAMRVSGWLLSSTLMLSAPNAARNRVPPADARNQVKSRMRIFPRGKGLPCGESPSFTGGLAFAESQGMAFSRGRAALFGPSFRRGARRPTDHVVRVASHLLVA